LSNVLNLDAVYRQPILVAHAPGSLGTALEAGSDAGNRELLMGVFRTAWAIPEHGVTGAAFSRWHLDPYALGAYPHLPVGADPSLYDQFAEPVGRGLGFAGDAASRAYPSTVHGAYLSGVREAERILGHL